MKQIQLCPVKFVRGRMVRVVWPVLILLMTCSSLLAQSLVPELVFMNPQLKTGEAGKDGAVYIFSNVGAGVDALVKIQGRSSELVTLSDPDMKGPDQDPVQGRGYDNAWQPRVSYGNGNAPEHSNWWMEFKISFVKHGYPARSVSVNQFFVSGLDIYGDGQKLHEFQSYYKMRYFTIGKNTDISALSVKGCLADPQLDGKRFDGPVKNSKSLVTNNPDEMVSNFYCNTSSLIVRVGAETGMAGSHSANRMYALWFKSLTYDVPVRTPLPLAWVALDTQPGNGLKLNWTTGSGQNGNICTLQCNQDENKNEYAAILADLLQTPNEEEMETQNFIKRNS